MNAMGIIVSLFSGAVGAVLVYVLNVRHQQQETRKQIASERRGLLRLVDVEIYLNLEKLSMIRDSPDVGEQYRAYSELLTSHWEESRVRVTQLLPPDHVGILVRYYGLLQSIGAYLGDEGKKPSRAVARNRNVREKTAIARVKRQDLLSVSSREAIKYRSDIRERAATYIDDIPDYYDLYSDNSDAEHEELESSEQGDK